jgi:hypothetical protein
VGDLDQETLLRSTVWGARIQITVHDAAEAPVPNVTVSGNWSAGTPFESSCTTNSSGWCYVRDQVPNAIGSVSYSVTDISGAASPYTPAANHDPDGDSDGTTIAVLKPGS